jgi:glycosyltransferase involved in cell wall biosynthesis
MKIFHLSLSSTGGAGIAAHRFYRMQLLSGQDVESVSKISNLTLASLIRNPIISLTAILDYFIVSRSKEHFFSFYRSKLNSVRMRRITKSIVHVHWAPGLTSVSNLKKLSNDNFKIFIHLHDIWFITGGCHHAMSCERYTKDCDACPFVNKPFRNAIKQAKSHKLDILMQENVFLIAPSRWIHEQVELASPELYLKSFVIPNPINIDDYRVLNKSLAKKILGLDPDQLVIGFVASNLSQVNKGIQNFVCEIEKSPILNCSNISLLFVGQGQIETSIKSLKLEHTTIKSRLSIAYSAMDIFINPSIVESFSYTNIEASLHKTPVLSINNGGSRDTVCNNLNGFSFDSNSEIISKIAELIQDKTLLNSISEMSRNFVVDNFSESVVNSKLSELYIS